ncbi:MAG: YiiX family permuted papain-like enzyme [Flavobacterium sp.]
MKKAIITFLIISLLIFAGLFVKQKFYDSNHKLQSAETEVAHLSRNNELKDGDIIFQTSLSNQSKAIQLATNSKYSHCGIIYEDGKDFYVFEAIQPVTTTPLSKWIARGENGKYVIKRLKNANAVLTPSTLNKMKEIGNEFKGKNYDLTFEWSDDKIYCSELIWKIYKRATGIEVGKLEKLSDFDLTNSAVKSKMNERYGAKIPLNETVISPAAIFDSDNLLTVRAN